MGSEEMAIHTI